ncbi:ATP-binding protein [Agaribacter flavus]|uniref:ATP-binding protein n=1 Tax=Agaribacter flavus TaxID=1902781 RepID=A0ABV7FUA4_9ALTE
MAVINNEVVLSNIKSLCEQKRLMPMYRALIEYMSQADEKIDFYECFLAMLQLQIDNDHMLKVGRLRKTAKLRWSSATLEDFKEASHRAVDFKMLAQLAKCHWIANFQHIIITGPTGAGKTHLACALVQSVIEQGYTALYMHFPALIRRLKMAERAGNDELTKLRRQLSKVRVLLIDDWGIQHLSSEERHLLFELIEMRDQNSSLIITSQYPTDVWHDAFQDKVVADSVLDRIVSYAILIDWDTDSYRRRKGAALAKASKERITKPQSKGNK